ncbi:MAG: mshD [Microbacteriaceae bacterium]|jgi:mycothiol synthase|nr:mshD [Microbacteriaceae bacterium]
MDAGRSPELSTESHRFLDTLTERSRRFDGQPPFSDQSLVDVVSGRRTLITADIDGRPAAAAILTVDSDLFDSTSSDSGTAGPAPTEAELVVDPDARHRGLGGQLVRDLIDAAPGELLIWAHGDHPDARALAARLGFAPVRELLQLRAPVPSASAASGERVAGPTTDTMSDFRPGVDDAEWLALNARSFADHPEQGSLVQADLDARVAESWFDRRDFIVARDDSGAMVGFCWLKVEGQVEGDSGAVVGSDAAIGEFYAVGVDPGHQGTGLGRRLVDAGMTRLAERGIRVASLYVEGDNTRALALYRSVGFDSHSIDIQYALASTAR